MPAQNVSSWIPALTGLVGAGIGALINQAYRDYRDRPILRVDIESCGRVRRPISLPKALRLQLYPLGSFRKWLDDAVKWDVAYAIEDNKYTISQLRDMMNLIPKYLVTLTFNQNRIQRFRNSLSTPENPPSAAAADTLSCMRSTWAERGKEDVFVAWAKNAEDVASKLDLMLAGDLEGYSGGLEGLRTLLDYLKRGFSPDATPQEKIVANPETAVTATQPFLLLELLVLNSGRSETLLRDTAVLRIGAKSYNLLGVVHRYGFEVYSGKYYRVKAASVEGVTFAQDPGRTTVAELQELQSLLADRTHRASLEIKDHRGVSFTKKDFAFREDE